MHSDPQAPWLSDPPNQRRGSPSSSAASPAPFGWSRALVLDGTVYWLRASLGTDPATDSRFVSKPIFLTSLH